MNTTTLPLALTVQPKPTHLTGKETGWGGQRGRDVVPHALPWPQKWATLTWAHRGCPHTGPHADTGSNLERRSPPAAHRPFLGKRWGSRREAAAHAPPGGQASRNLLQAPRQGPSLLPAGPALAPHRPLSPATLT